MTEQQPPSRSDLRAERAAAKARRPWVARHKILTALGVIVVLIIIGAAVGSTNKGSSTSTVTPAATNTAPAATTPAATASASGETGTIANAGDVKITKCGVGEFGGASATVVVTNHSSKTSNYIIEIAFESKDGKTQYDTGDAAVDSLNPGQSSAPQTADALSTSPAPPGFVCRLSQLTRYSANG